ncbi:MAG: hypothetical protein ACFFED_14065 [Candidatus Thorarchaeota archaeon]
MTKQMTPFGVSILAAINIVVGFFGVLEGVTLDFIIVGGEITLVGSFQLGALFIGIFQIIAGLGLWRMKSWAWYLAGFVTIIGLVTNFLIVFFDFSLLFEYLMVILMRILILIYLFQKDIKSKFR